MMALNRVMMVGNLTRDPELRRTAAGMAVGSFGLAVNERFATREGEEREEVCFVDIEVWGKPAESCGQYLRKGAPAFIEGRLRMNEWEDRETGQKRSRLLVRADRVQFLGRPRPGEAQPRQGGDSRPAPQADESTHAVRRAPSGPPPAATGGVAPGGGRVDRTAAQARN